MRISILTKIFILFLFLFLYSCEKNSDKFFNYDSITHYTLEENSLNTESLFTIIPKNKIDSLRIDLIIAEKPSVLDDTVFIANLDRVGFRKKIVSKNNFVNIDGIYKEKFSPLTKTSTSCEPIYRDILIFRFKKKITGISKICLECQKSINIGKQGKLKSFERESDYLKLQQILR